MAKAKIDGRMFLELQGIGLWVSHREYKTESGARALISKISRTHPLPYTLVKTGEYSYRPRPDGAVYRVAVKTADVG